MTSILTIAEVARERCDLIAMHISRTHDEQFLLKKDPGHCRSDVTPQQCGKACTAFIFIMSGSNP